MHNIGRWAVAVVGLLHFYFLVLEMFLWTKQTGLRTFDLTPERAESSKVLAANQGLYNGLLGAGLIWSSLVRPDFDVMIFFLVCVIIAWHVRRRHGDQKDSIRPGNPRSSH